MSFNYYHALNEEAERIKDMFNSESAEFICEQKRLSDIWRDTLTDKLYTDFLPPIERRDLLTLVQNMGYIAYEVEQLKGIKTLDSAEGVLMGKELAKCIEIFIEETREIKKRKCSATRLREAVFRLLSVWRDCVISSGSSLLCDGFEGVAEALLRYADAIETTVILL